MLELDKLTEQQWDELMRIVMWWWLEEELEELLQEQKANPQPPPSAEAQRRFEESLQAYFGEEEKACKRNACPVCSGKPDSESD